LLVRRAGVLVSRDDIRGELWPEGTFVDFDQSVNFCVSQIRDVLRDVADRPLYIETVPKRGYRFIAPVEAGATVAPPKVLPDGSTSVHLQKALWTNIAELRIAEQRRRRNIRLAAAFLVVLAACLIVILMVVK
jgi:hypothetical protein